MTDERSARYCKAYVDDYGFESVMVHYRQRLVLERLALHRPRNVIEVGCGMDLLSEAWFHQGGSAAQWVVVEPVAEFAEKAAALGHPNLHVIQACFEDALDRVRAVAPAPDLIVCSGVLHEVPDAHALLTAMATALGPNGVLHVNVPNAQSLHRRLAKSMGLIGDTKAMSARNLSLLQNRVYDLDSLTADLVRAGFETCDNGGYLIKPFTHRQMEAVTPLLGDAVVDGLYALGKELPGLASEIFVEARKLRS